MINQLTRQMAANCQRNVKPGLPTVKIIYTTLEIKCSCKKFRPLQSLSKRLKNGFFKLFGLSKKEIL